MTGSGLSSRLHFESCSPFRHHHELASSGILDMRATLTCRDLSIKILIYNNKVEFNWPVAYPPAGPGLQGKCFESSCVLCSAVAYCCGAVAPCAIAALLGRFLPRLGPLVHSSGPFLLGSSFRVTTSSCSQVCNCAPGNDDRGLFTPLPPGTGRVHRTGSWPARPPAWRNRRPPGRSAVRAGGGAHPYRPRG